MLKWDQLPLDITIVLKNEKVKIHKAFRTNARTIIVHTECHRRFLFEKEKGQEIWLPTETTGDQESQTKDAWRVLGQSVRKVRKL